ncbi:hypothetical protein ACFLXE_03430 [Chloroflexota bacterium]
MITVTEGAALQLKQILTDNATDPDHVLRVPDASEGFVLELGPATEGDEVVEYEGSPVLYIDSEVSLALADTNLFIDCLDTPEGPQLTLYSGEEVSMEDLQAGCDCGCHGHDHLEHTD